MKQLMGFKGDWVLEQRRQSAYSLRSFRIEGVVSRASPFKDTDDTKRTTIHKRPAYHYNIHVYVYPVAYPEVPDLLYESKTEAWLAWAEFING